MRLTGFGRLFVVAVAATAVLAVVNEPAGMVAGLVIALAALGALGGLHGGPRRDAAEDPNLRESFARSVDRDFFVDG